jgi:N-acyl-L-homoserine lactone synthetase
MKNLLQIKVHVYNAQEVIQFGIPTTKHEIEKMYKLRYIIYRKHNYIQSQKKTLDIDYYDRAHKSVYFIAKVKNTIIGSVRLIITKKLPTEAKCFSFAEPPEIASIPRAQRGELSRLVIAKFQLSNGEYIPRNIVMVGLLKVLVEYCKAHMLLGGYSFIKNSLWIKLKKLRFPIHFIPKYTQIYNQKYLHGYFHQKNNPVYPVYYMRSEVEHYLERVFKNRMIFRRESSKKLELKNNFFIRILRTLHLLG